MSSRYFAAAVLMAFAGLVGYGCSAASGAANSPGSGGGAATGGGSNGGTGGGSGGIDGGGAQGGSAGNPQGGSGGSGASAGSGGSSGSGGGLGHCDPKNGDLAGCECTAGTPPRPCYPSSLDPATRHIGDCKDGTQKCTGGGEFPVWGNCTGAVGPASEVCNDGQDNDCNNKADCGDPSCATFPGCGGSCANGQTRPCYTGPPNTQGVGTCRAGTQTCTNGNWPTTCTGEVTPVKEVCSDGLDHNCNHLPGCLDAFACALDPACQPTCKADPGCSCPSGSGETATCPDGTYGITKGATITKPGTVECCPCTASDCGNPGCCAESVCKGNSQCSGFQCGPLPASCGGKVGFDCDDFPEDCDVTCCKCTQCPP